MSRRRYNKNDGLGIIILIYFLLIPFILAFLLVKGIVYLIRKNKQKNKIYPITNTQENQNIEDDCKSVDNKYEQKDSLLTHHEKYFYDILEENFGTNYKIQCQVNLASIINKTEQSKYQNELFRNVDFGIFDKETLKPLLLIEINDSSHKSKDRYERDLKVRKILEQSQLKLITFYTYYDNKRDYVINRIKENL